MLILLALACTAPAILIDETPQPGQGWEDDVPVGTDPDDPDVLDPAPWVGATVRVSTPAAGAILPLDQAVAFEAAVLGADGQPVSADRIAWSSSDQPGWGGLGLAFSDDGLAPGPHGITVSAELPTGDVLTHTVQVHVQHPGAGTWAGLFQATGDFGDLQFTCGGSAILGVDAAAENAAGDGACVAGLGVGTLPLDFVFDLQVDPLTGLVDGEVGTVLVGGLVYDFPAEGAFGPDGLELSWGGDVPFLNFSVQATLSAEQVGLDPL